MNRLSYTILLLYFIQANVEAFTKIVNGRDATRGEYPFQAMMFYGSSNYFVCGGTILDRQWILTAAHCVYSKRGVKPSKYTIAVGKHEMETDLGSEQYRGVTDIIMHENYDHRTSANDIALMKLDSPISYDDYVQPVTLASQDDATNTNCWASGFGVVRERDDTIADTLQELKTKVISDKKCRKQARRYNAEDSIDGTVVCTKDKRKGVCSGDSGGPLGCYDVNGDYIQFGVLSWGSTKCITGFNVYTRVTEYLDWISTTTYNN